jgi:hypothetical protein
MINPYGITFDDYSLRWAAAEGVPEAVIAAICLIGAKTVDEIVAKLTPAELGQVVNIVGRSPSCYPPGVYAALKSKRDLASPPPRADSPPPKEALKKEARRPPERQPTSTLGALGHRKRLQPYVSVMPPTAKTGRPPTSEGLSLLLVTRERVAPFPATEVTTGKRARRGGEFEPIQETSPIWLLLDGFD